MKRAHIVPMTNGDEYDALTAWRHSLNWGPGKRKVIKRAYNRRQRAQLRLEARLARKGSPAESDGKR